MSAIGKNHAWDWGARASVTIEGREYPLWTCQACELQMAGASRWRKRKGGIWTKDLAGPCPPPPWVPADLGTDEGEVP